MRCPGSRRAGKSWAGISRNRCSHASASGLLWLGRIESFFPHQPSLAMAKEGRRAEARRAKAAPLYHHPVCKNPMVRPGRRPSGAIRGCSQRVATAKIACACSSGTRRPQVLAPPNRPPATRFPDAPRRRRAHFARSRSALGASIIPEPTSVPGQASGGPISVRRVAIERGNHQGCHGLRQSRPSQRRPVSSEGREGFILRLPRITASADTR